MNISRLLAACCEVQNALPYAIIEKVEPAWDGIIFEMGGFLGTVKYFYEDESLKAMKGNWRTGITWTKI